MTPRSRAPCPHHNDKFFRNALRLIEVHRANKRTCMTLASGRELRCTRYDRGPRLRRKGGSVLVFDRKHVMAGEPSESTLIGRNATLTKRRAIAACLGALALV